VLGLPDPGQGTKGRRRTLPGGVRVQPSTHRLKLAVVQPIKEAKSTACFRTQTSAEEPTKDNIENSQFLPT
jgi:hypothetical protein